ncbi:MAG: hypothetical protein KDD37_02175 [Bdellovibrionales bacterium]|nr:hypothetical protein [Bdellovibrionales bacterium]
MRQERHQLNGRKFYPILVQKAETSTVAYLYNLSADGFCMALPKRSGKDFLNDLVLETESLFLSNKLHLSILDVNDSLQVDMGDVLDVKMAPFRMDKVNCKFEIVFSREDDNYTYLGGKTHYNDQESRSKVVEELEGIKQRQEREKTKKAPIKGALWLAVNISIFTAMVSFLSAA